MQLAALSLAQHHSRVFPASHVKDFQTHCTFSSLIPIYWVLKDNRSYFSIDEVVIKPLLLLPWSLPSEAKPRQAVQVKAWIKLIASYGLHFPCSAILWKAKKLCIIQILARTFDTSCSEFFHLLFPPLLSKEDSNMRACRSSSVQIEQRDVFRQRNF